MNIIYKIFVLNEIYILYIIQIKMMKIFYSSFKSFDAIRVVSKKIKFYNITNECQSFINFLFQFFHEKNNKREW